MIVRFTDLTIKSSYLGTGALKRNIKSKKGLAIIVKVRKNYCCSTVRNL